MIRLEYTLSEDEVRAAIVYWLQNNDLQVCDEPTIKIQVGSVDIAYTIHEDYPMLGA